MCYPCPEENLYYSKDRYENINSNSGSSSIILDCGCSPFAID